VDVELMEDMMTVRCYLEVMSRSALLLSVSTIYVWVWASVPGTRALALPTSRAQESCSASGSLLAVL
jgi:hypothetical protein